jgi:hypothetical protein
LASVASIGRETITVDPERNIISDSLTYIREEDIKIGVKAICIKPDNSRLVAYYPDSAFGTASGGGDKTIKSGYELRTQYCTTLQTLMFYGNGHKNVPRCLYKSAWRGV